MTQGIRPYLLLTLFCLLLALPGLSAVPPLDRDESRFMQATRQMLESGDFIRIQFQDEMRAKKPVGAYWLQALSVRTFSDPEATDVWPYRLVSALSAWLSVLLTFAFARPLLGGRAALLGAGFLASAVLLISEAHQAKTDALLLLCSIAAQGTLARFYVVARAREIANVGGGGCTPPAGGRPLPALPGPAWALLFWIAQGAGILVKGPIVPVISLLAIIALGIADRRWRWLTTLKPGLGVLVTVAMAAPWFVAVSQATHGAFVGEAVQGDLLPKLLGSQESHGGWPGLYVLLSSVTFWPASLLLWPAAAIVWRQRQRLAFRVLLAWVIPAWIMFELVPTKLPHYVLPLYPAIALLVAALVSEGHDVFRTKLAKVWYGVWVLLGLLLAAASVVLPMELGSGFSPATVPAAIAIGLASLLPAILAIRGNIAAAALTLGLTAAVTYPPIFQGVIPSLDKVFLSRGIAKIVTSIGSDGPVALAGYSEPSAIFLLGTKTRIGDGAGAAQHLAAHPRALVVVSNQEAAAFAAEAGKLGLVLDRFGEVRGLNAGKGKNTDLAVWGAKTP